MGKKKSKSASKSASTSNGTSKPNGAPVTPNVPTPPRVASPEPVRKRARSDSEEAEVDRMMSQEPPEQKPPEPSPEQLKEKGNELFRAKRYNEAIEWYGKAIAADPTSPAFLMNRAAAYIALKRYSAALTDCQRAHSLQSSKPQAKTLLRLSRCQLALGDAASALSSASSALALKDPVANQAAKEAVDKATSVQNHLDRFFKARASGEWTMARFALQEAERESESGDGVKWRCWKVEAEIGAGRLDDAAIAVMEAMRLDRESTEVLYLRGLIFLLQNQLPKAVSHAQEALRLDPDYTKARQLMRRAKDIERLKEAGNSAFKEGRLEEALKMYSDALDLVGDKKEEANGGWIRAVLLSNRATALVKLKRLDEALEDVTTSLELQPASYKALRTRARILLAKEDYEEAVREFKKATEQAGMEGSADERALEQETRKAEVALKRSKTKDYYKILGLEKNCDDTDIKKAYRRESLKHHPDKGGDEEKFKLVQEAHSVLSDGQRRRRYDLGEDEDGLTSGGGMGDMGGFPSFMFTNMGGMGGMGGDGRRYRSAGGFGGHPSFGGQGYESSYSFG